MKKYIAEFLGTFVLVLFGCGTAVVTGGLSGGTGLGYLGVLAIAFAFGLAIVAAAYGLAGISGCHVNPAVSLSLLLLKKMTPQDFIGYVVAQFAGAIAGAAILKAITASSSLLAGTASLGQNGYGAESAVGLSLPGAILVEIILTCVFVFTILYVTSQKNTQAIAGLVIGLTLTFVHILGIPLTGTSVNPARSFGPALLAGGTALSQVWVFLLAPLVGAALASLLYKPLAPNAAVE